MKIYILLLTLIVFSYGKVESDRITKTLPGCSDWNFGAYSGYIPVDDHNEYHYVFLESQNRPESDPLIVIFSGGPGCSSMNTLFQENGPWVFYGLDSNLLPHDNKYSWNKFANTLYIESPAGVGFNTGYQGEENTDVKSATLNVQFLDNWFKAYPEFISNDLYLNGESYGGIYVPMLAFELSRYNYTTVTGGYMNLKGISVGNPMTDWDYDATPAFVELSWYHGLIPLSLKTMMDKNECNYKKFHLSPLSKECQEALDLFEKYTEGINPLDIYRKFGDGFAKSKENLPFGAAAQLSALGTHYSEYLNREDIRSIFNIDKSVDSFFPCKDVNYTYCMNGSKWTYPLLRDYGYKILVYSGDTDGVVPTIGTWKWIEWLHWDRLSEQKDVIRDGKVAGFLHQFKGMDFFIFHGAGHLVPIWKKELSMDMMKAFISNSTIS